MRKNFTSRILPAAPRISKIRNAARLERQETLHNSRFEYGGSMLASRKILLAGLIVARKYTAASKNPSITALLHSPETPPRHYNPDQNIFSPDAFAVRAALENSQPQKSCR